MTTVKTNLIEPEGATTTLDVGESGGALVIGADSLKANVLKTYSAPTVISHTSTPGGGTWTVPAGVTSVEYLVVGGGGSGGSSYGTAGGGGAGGVRQGTMAVVPGTALTVTVGAGGAARTTGSPAQAGADGADSVFDSITASGGGGGGANAAGLYAGRQGGSGGGGNKDTSVGSAGNAGGYTPAEGYPGAGGESSPGWAAGGGGGAGAGGTKGLGTGPGNSTGGPGGSGISSNITGTWTSYGGGGGGSVDDASSAVTGYGGVGGGGRGAHYGSPNGATDGTANTGGGGGGAYANSGGGGLQVSGAGGSGIVVLKYALPGGTAQSVFTSDGSGNVSGVNSKIGGVQTLITETTVSSAVSNISFTSGISNTYDEYIFEFININAATDGVQFRFQCSTDGGSNYNTTMTTTYFQAYNDEDAASYALTYLTNEDQAQGTAMQNLGNAWGNQTWEVGCGDLHLFNPGSTAVQKNFFATINGYDGTSGGGNYMQNNYIAGNIQTTSALNAIRFEFSSGNIAGGTIKMYGIR